MIESTHLLKIFRVKLKIRASRGSACGSEAGLRLEGL